MENLEAYVGWFGLVFGVLGRIFVPWLNARRTDPRNAQWSWRYVWPQVVAVVIVGFLLPFVLPNLAEVGSMSFVSASAAGWGVADIGRLLDKRITGGG